MSPETGFIHGLFDRLNSFFSFIYSSFFGSETQEPYTEGYIWMANQFGHFFIGFGGMFLLTWIASYYLHRPVPSHTYDGRMIDPKGREPVMARTVWLLAILWFLVWMFKEWFFDYWKGSQLAFYFVDPYLDDLVWDTATDSFFYTAGIAVALAHFGLLPITPIPALIIVFFISAALATYWVPARQRLETAGTPYFIRLNSGDLGLDATINELPKEAFLERFLQEDKARSMGVEPAVRANMNYPFQFLMGRQESKKQILAVGGTQLIPRFFIAIANERVIRQKVRESCDTRFITFRDLLNSKITKKIEAGVEKWEIAAIPLSNGTITSSACPVEAAELVIVDQTPAIRVAATQVAALIAFAEDGIASEASAFSSTALQAVEAEPDVAAAIRAVDAGEVRRKMQNFLKALSGKTVIWVLDSDRAVNGWTRNLQRLSLDQSIGIIEFKTLP